MPIRFASSPRSSVGIEWELMLVDESGDLVGEAPGILDALKDRPGITGELLTNTVEIVSDPHARVADAVRDVRDRIAEVRAECATRGIGLLSAGSHPSALWHEQRIAEATRYDKLIRRTQWWGRNMMIWGMHVHVGVERRAKVMPLLAELGATLPHLQALTASSPYWAGEETGYASNRALVFQQLPTAGLPWALDDWPAFEGYVDDLVRTGVVDDETEVRWDARPAPRWGTLEVRACDAPSSLHELAAVAALAQCLVERGSRRLDSGRGPAPLAPWFHRENKWRVARYGLDAVTVVDAGGREQPVREHLAELLVELAPIADELGCAKELGGVEHILALGGGADRQRAVAQAHDGDLAAVVRHLRAEFDAERPLAADATPH